MNWPLFIAVAPHAVLLGFVLYCGKRAWQ